MALRTTPEKCEEICHVDSADNIPWTGFISMGNKLTDKVSAADSDSELDSTDLELIERNLACHFRGIRDQYLQNKSHGQASAGFQGQTGMALQATHYGQAAMTLDVTGYLAKIDRQAREGKKVASADWGGTQLRDDRAIENETDWIN